MSDQDSTNRGSADISTSELREYEMYVASTRPVRLVGDDFDTMLARSALESIVDQVDSKCIWILNEHLEHLPPIGVCKRAEIREAEDGEAELYYYGVEVPKIYGQGLGDLQNIISQLPESDCPDISVELTYSRRNFDQGYGAIIESESNGVAKPVERQSALPPLEFALLIPVIWGASKFLGAFLSKLGEAAFEGLSAKMASWSKRSKDPNRTVVFQLVFRLSDGNEVCGFVLAPPDMVEYAVEEALVASGDLATIAGLLQEQQLLPDMKKAAFFLDGNTWQLGWWTDGSETIITEWFLNFNPDIEGILGR